MIQGSCLGPILFVLFVNDITDGLDNGTTAKLYADDLKLYAKININSIVNSLQNSLDVIYRWSLEWQLSISFLKCFILVLNVNCRIDFNCNNYVFKLGNNILEYKNAVRDLGIVVDGNLKFSDHIAEITTKAHQRANLILRCFQSKNPKSLLQAFKTYVRPLLEYNSQIWSPLSLTEITKIDKVQKQFTKRIPGLFNLSYYHRLQSLNIESLELRRLRADLTMTYKILFHHTGMNPNNFFLLQKCDHYKLRSHGFQIKPANTFKTVRSDRCLFNRVISIWNSLPSTTDFSSLKGFKDSIQKITLVKYCRLNFN